MMIDAYTPVFAWMTWVGDGIIDVLWCLAVVQQFLSESFLSWQAAAFLVLWLERKPIFLGLYLPLLIGISRMPALPAPNLGYMRHKENPQHSPPCCSLGAKAPSWCTTFLPLFTVLFCLVYTQYSAFFTVPSTRNWEKHVDSIFLEAAFLPIVSEETFHCV